MRSFYYKTMASTLVSSFNSGQKVYYHKLRTLCDSEKELVEYLLSEGLLGDRSGQCPSCKKGNRHLIKEQGNYFWKCGARKCRKKVSIRKGSFFENSKLSFGIILCLTLELNVQI